MISNKRISKMAGALIIIGMIIGGLSIVPSVESENFLQQVGQNQRQVLTGATFQFLLVPVYIAFSLLLYRMLKPLNHALSVGFLGFRFVAGTFQLIGVILLPLFVLLSESYTVAVPSELSFYETAGDALRLLRDLTNHLGVILATGLGNVLLYTILYRRGLIPKWLSLWGFLGNSVIMLAGFFVLFQLIEVVSPEYGMLSIPLVLQEIVFAIWLMVKGVNNGVNQI